MSPDPRDFSVVLGGPLFQLLGRARLADDALLLVRKRIVVISTFAWLPMLVLSVLGGSIPAGNGARALPRRHRGPRPVPGRDAAAHRGRAPGAPPHAPPGEPVPKRWDTSVQTPFLAVLGFWLFCIFFCAGPIGPRNGTVVAALLLAALSVSATIFLIMELDRPYQGLIHISGAPMRAALTQLGR